MPDSGRHGLVGRAAPPDTRRHPRRHCGNTHQMLFGAAHDATWYTKIGRLTGRGVTPGGAGAQRGELPGGRVTCDYAAPMSTRATSGWPWTDCRRMHAWSACMVPPGPVGTTSARRVIRAAAVEASRSASGTTTHAGCTLHKTRGGQKCRAIWPVRKRVLGRGGEWSMHRGPCRVQDGMSVRGSTVRGLLTQGARTVAWGGRGGQRRDAGDVSFTRPQATVMAECDKSRYFTTVPHCTTIHHTERKRM